MPVPPRRARRLDVAEATPPSPPLVYGSLMRGGGAHRRLADIPGVRRVGRGSIAARLLDLGAYPGVVRARETDARVHGEVWELTAHTGVLRALDRYEGFDRASPETSLFVRRRVTVRVGTRRIRAWAYFVTRPPVRARVVTSGDWRRQ